MLLDASRNNRPFRNGSTNIVSRPATTNASPRAGRNSDKVLKIVEPRPAFMTYPEEDATEHQ
jgi:hypothetical protein